jgi:hypothetical protein
LYQPFELIFFWGKMRMRVWDIDPGFLNDKSLLGEHREIHAVYTILTKGKKGYARHPETLRWTDHLNALILRHKLVAGEMALRYFNHQSPLPRLSLPISWPDTLIDTPGRQFDLLADKYKSRPQGRIPLPDNCQTLWAAHKYSTLARDPALYKSLGRQVAQNRIAFDDLAATLTHTLRHVPQLGRLNNALLHMWGYIQNKPVPEPGTLPNGELLEHLKQSAIKENISYLMKSTALGELAFWCTCNYQKGDNHGKPAYA